MFNFNFNSKIEIKDTENTEKESNKFYMIDDQILVNHSLEKNIDHLLKKIDTKSFYKNMYSLGNQISNNENLYYNTNFIAFSDINQELYIIITLNDKTKPFYCFFCFNKDQFKYRKELNFKNTHKIKKEKNYLFNQKEFEKSTDETFILEGIYLHPKNQNQLCFFSKDKLAFVKNLNEIIQGDTNHLELEIKYESGKLGIYYKKFKFWDFDDYFGLLTSDNILNIFSIENDICETSINLDNNNIVDFSFGRTNKIGIWEPFSAFFLIDNGNILYCCPIFPRKFDAKKIMNFDKSSQFWNLYSNLDLNNFNSSSDNLLTNLLKIFKFSETKEKNKNEFPYDKKNIIEINNYLYNNNNKLILNSIYVNHNLKSKNNYLNKSSSIIEKNKYPFLQKFTQIHILSIFPLTIIRVYENNILEVIILLDELKPKFYNIELENKDNNFLNSILIETKIFQRINNINELYLKIIENKSKPTQIMINYINDIYILNLNYSEKFYNKFNDKKSIKEKDLRLIQSDLIPIVKIDYSKQKNLKNLRLGYIGIEFLNLDKTSKSLILVLNSNSSSHIVSHKFICCKKIEEKINEDILFKIKLKSEFFNFSLLRNNFEKLKKYHHTDYFEILEDLYKKL